MDRVCFLCNGLLDIGYVFPLHAETPGGRITYCQKITNIVNTAITSGGCLCSGCAGYIHTLEVAELQVEELKMVVFNLYNKIIKEEKEHEEDDGVMGRTAHHEEECLEDVNCFLEIKFPTGDVIDTSSDRLMISTPPPEQLAALSPEDPDIDEVSLPDSTGEEAGLSDFSDGNDDLPWMPGGINASPTLRRETADPAGENVQAVAKVRKSYYMKKVKVPKEPKECKRSYKKRACRVLSNEEKPFACRFCSFRSQIETKTRKHENAEHGELAVIYCDICKHKHKSFRQLAKHKAAVHSLILPYPCIPCRTEFRSEKEYSHHLKTSHRPTVPCYICGKVLLKEGLNTHLKMVHDQHREEGDLLCETCSKTFKSVNLLNSHMKLHNNPVHECTSCDKKFKWFSSLRSHIQSAHNPEGRKLKCDVCSWEFSDKNNLKNHMYTHSEAKPYTCHKCDRGFIRKDMWSKHFSKCEL